jgi:hypothetical protein
LLIGPAGIIVGVSSGTRQVKVGRVAAQCNNAVKPECQYVQMR